MGLLKRFWEWNKKIFNDDTPIIQWSYHNDGKGNKMFGFKAFGSKIMAVERNHRELENEFEEREEVSKNVGGEKVRDLIFINPKISKLSREKEWVPEGCLSVRPLYGKTHRSKKAIITAYNEKGKKFTRGASGLLSQIFQHETDHLDGVLFIDHAKDVKEEKLDQKIRR